MKSEYLNSHCYSLDHNTLWCKNEIWFERLFGKTIQLSSFVSHFSDQLSVYLIKLILITALLLLRWNCKWPVLSTVSISGNTHTSLMRYVKLMRRLWRERFKCCMPNFAFAICDAGTIRSECSCSSCMTWQTLLLSSPNVTSISRTEGANFTSFTTSCLLLDSCALPCAGMCYILNTLIKNALYCCIT